MSERISLGESSFVNGAFNSLPLLDPRLANTFASGSRNQLALGLGGARPWKGYQSKGANTGGRKMVQIGSTYGQIKDIGGLHASGSFWEDIGRSRWGIGSGQPGVEGSDMTGITLSTILQVSIAVAGVYDAAHTYDAGLGQPSSPDVAILATPSAGYPGVTNGPVSFKIARLRLTTGARSIASLTSAVIVPANQSFRITFPLAATGQTHWRVFGTQLGFGGVGLSYALRYGIGTDAVLDIPESVVAAGTVDGVARSLEFDYLTGDLVPELAYIDDYPPPAGTHAVRIENVMVVLGAFSDSSSAVSSTSPGTVGAVSLPNFYESYKPDHRVYFPGPVRDHRARLTDAYAYVALDNCITALQYVGLRDGPAVALTMIWPDIGISKPHNWTQVYGLIYAFAQGAPVRMLANGDPDYKFAAPVQEAMKNWDDNTVVSFDPSTMSVVWLNGTEAWSFCLQNEQWSPVCYSVDAGVAGTALAAVSSQGEMIVSFTNGGSQTAYSWDTGATKMPITSVTPYDKFRTRTIVAPPIRSANIRELEIAFDTDRATDPLIISIFRNLRQTFVRDAVTTNGSNVITSASLDTRARVGDMVCVYGSGVGGADVDYLIGRISAIGAGPPSVTILNPTTGAAANAGASLANCYMTVARQIFTYGFTGTGPQHTNALLQPYVIDAQSYAVGVTVITAATAGQIELINVAGNPKSGRRLATS